VSNLRELSAIVLLALILVAMVMSNRPTILYVLGLVSALGVLLILTSVNAMAALIILKKDARFENWRQIILPLTMGLFFAIVQLTIIGLVRFNVTGTLAGLPGI
jgi:heme/copper-type cytochrome/quinol oxidase subunit 3